MTVTVSIPTILRTHTGGEKRVDAPAATRCRRSSTTWRPTTPGSPSAWSTNGKLHRFVNVYVNDEDVRFSGGLDTAIADGDSVTILPAVAGG